MGLSQAIDDIIDIMEGTVTIRINTQNDVVQVFMDVRGKHRWHRVDTSNGQVVAESGQGYMNQEYAWAAAVAYNPGVTVEHGE